MNHATKLSPKIHAIEPAIPNAEAKATMPISSLKIGLPTKEVVILLFLSTHAYDQYHILFV